MRRIVIIGLVLALAAGIALALWQLSSTPWHRPMLKAVRYVRRAGWRGYFVFGSVYLFAVVLGLPTSLLTLVAGFLYGALRGSAVVIGPSLVGAAVSFGLARSIARDRVEKRLRRYPRAAAVDAAVGEQPLMIMTLLRLSPILPSNILNYVFALTKVRFPHYIAACAMAMVPGTLMFAYAGAAITSVSRLVSAESSPGTTILTWVGLAATVAASLVITYLARRLMAKREAGTPARA